MPRLFEDDLRHVGFNGDGLAIDFDRVRFGDSGQGEAIQVLSGDLVIVDALAALTLSVDFRALVQLSE